MFCNKLLVLEENIFIAVMVAMVIRVKKDEKQDIVFHNYFLLLPRLLVLVHAHILGLHDICEPKKRQTSIERYIEVKSNGLTGGSERNVNIRIPF